MTRYQEFWEEFADDHMDLIRWCAIKDVRHVGDTKDLNPKTVEAIIDFTQRLIDHIKGISDGRG